MTVPYIYFGGGLITANAQEEMLALAEKIDWWIEHPREREEMGRRYGESARQYALERSIEQTEDMFRQAIHELNRR